MRTLYRGMKADGDHPLVAATGTGLGVRVPGDIEPDDNGNVHPGSGMSVAPDDPMFLQPHRRPIEFAGTAKHPVWAIQTERLPDTLEFVADSVDHGLIGPASVQPLNNYEAALASTRKDWWMA